MRNNDKKTNKELQATARRPTEATAKKGLHTKKCYLLKKMVTY